MLHDITVQELLELKQAVLIDVRSEKEFREATIPGAINIPLFNNEERAEIGTIYTQESPKKAMEAGLRIAGSKLYSLYEEIYQAAEKRPVLLFCWRGGLRSKSLATVLDLMGFQVLRLNGGYKAYRKHVVEFFAQEFPWHVVVVKGNTGTGKTELLRRLKEEGYPVIDLEGLSNHRGSVFGDLGLGEQPSQKQFESLLFHELLQYRNFPYIVVECESRKIGRLTLPSSLAEAMKEGTEILLYDSEQNRIDRLVREYTQSRDATDRLKEALLRLKKILGNAALHELLSLLDIKAYHQFAAKLIHEYYDKLYGYPNEEQDWRLCISNELPERALQELRDFLDKDFGFPVEPK